MRIFLQVSLLLSIIGFNNVSFSQETPVSGNITSNTTWTVTNSPYRVVDEVTVQAGVTLTIEPGVIVKFDSALSITINGVLLANGTETDSILFTSSSTLPSVGQWKQLRFTNNTLTSNITYCIFEYAGNGNSTPIQMIPSAKLFHKNNSYRYNSIQAIGIEGGNIVIPDAVWYNDGIPYLVLAGIAIHNDGGDGKLEIKPGVVVRFNLNTGVQIGSNYYSTLYRGQLQAIGKPDSLITFTSSSGANNDWGGLYFHNASDADGAVSNLEYCVIEKAGQPVYGFTSNIYCESTNQPTVSNSIIQYSGGHGILLRNSSPMFSNDTIRNSAVTGIYVWNSSPTLTNNVIESNLEGIFVNGGKPVISNNAMSNNTTYPIRMIPNSSPFINGNTYTNNGPEVIGVNGGSILIPDAVWYNDGIPYLVLGGIAIHNDGGDGKLEIKPGVVVRFNPNTGIQIGANYYSTLYRGQLQAIGKPDSLITFTSSSGANNDWGGLYFHNASDADGAVSNLEYCVIEKAGQPVYGFTSNIYCESTNQPTVSNSIIQYSGGHGILLRNSSPMFSNDTIRNSAVTGIYVWNSSPTLTNNVIESNLEGVFVNGGKPVISNNTIKNNTTYPIRMASNTSPFINGNTYTNNGTEVIGVNGGGIVIPDAVWYNDGIPYLVLGGIAIHNDGGDGKLEIKPGVVVRFNPNTGIQIGANYYSTLYRGQLQAIGKPDSLITFTSSSGANNDWGGLYFHNASDADGAVSNLEYCVIEKAGQPVYGYTSNIYCESTNQPTVSNSIIQNSGGHGIFLNGGSTTPQIFQNKIHSNNVGIYCTGNANPLISGSIQKSNEIYNNTNFGVQNTSSGVTVNARHNWWGDPSGPYHPTTNPTGLGNSVSDYVDYNNYNTPAISIEPEIVDFNGVRVNTTSVDSFMIRNTGTAYLNIYQITSQNSEFGISVQTASIPPSDSSIFYVTFNPNEMGKRTTKLFIVHDASTSPDSLIATGVGIAPIFSQSKTSVNFGDLGVSFTQVDSIYINNTGTYQLSVDSIYSTDGQFTFYPNTLSVAVGDSQKFYIVFQPTSLGIKSGKIIFLHDGISGIDSIEVSGNGVTDVQNENGLPKEFALYQNYPNPFNPSTIINYQLPIANFVTLKVYDVLGREVATLVDEYKQAGIHNFKFRNSKFEFSSGVYFYRLVAGDPSTGSPKGQAGQGFVQTKKLLLMK